MAFTAGFADARRLTDHFNKHKGRMGVATEKEYLERADMFLGGPIAAGVLYGTRASGDHIRFNPATQEFGVLSRHGVIRTFHVRKTKRNAVWFQNELTK